MSKCKICKKEIEGRFGIETNYYQKNYCVCGFRAFLFKLFYGFLTSPTPSNEK